MSENKILLCISQSIGYKMGSKTLRVSNFSPIMGFMASFDTQDQVKYWFFELNNVSATKIVSRNNMLLCISQSNGYKMGSEILRVSNFSPIMGFMASLTPKVG